MSATVIPVGVGGGLGFNVGTGWQAMTGAADALTVGTATFAGNGSYSPSTARG